MARDAEDRVRRSSEELVRVARSMRHQPTRAEEVLWQRLRRRHHAGLKFRRQHPIGRFVLDFYCPELKLVIEVDGAIHETQEDRDATRMEWLKTRGYHVLRFRNDDVLHRLPLVVQRIDDAVHALRTDNPLPELGEGGEPKW